MPLQEKFMVTQPEQTTTQHQKKFMFIMVYIFVGIMVSFASILSFVLNEEIFNYNQELQQFSTISTELDKNKLVGVIDNNLSVIEDLSQSLSHKMIKTILITAAAMILLMLLLVRCFYNKVVNYLDHLLIVPIKNNFQIELLQFISIITNALHTTQKVNDLISNHLHGVTDVTENAALDIMTNVSNIDSEVYTLSEELSAIMEQVNGIKMDSNNEIASVRESLDSMSHYVEERKNEVLQSNLKVTDLTSKIEDLRKLTDLVTDIAAETNLLALNASIEAARAGDHGLGFAVVAAEVRKLSDQSENVVTEIQKSIELVMSTVKQHMKTIENDNENSDIEQLHSFSVQLKSVIALNSRYDDFSNKMLSVLENRVDVVSNSVANALGNIQFQDITRQRLEQIQLTTKTVNKHLNLVLGSLDNMDSLSSIPMLNVNDLLSDYAMDEQRRIHETVTGVKLEDSGDDKPAIELF